MDGKLNLHPKVAAGLLAGWVTVIIVYSLQQWGHVTLPSVVSAALTGLIAFAAGWLAPNQVDTGTSAGDPLVPSPPATQ